VSAAVAAYGRAERVEATERWLTFEVGGAPFALPILAVLEVAEPGRTSPVPSLSRAVGGVMHYHGDALPIVTATALLEAEPAGPPQNVVVLADQSGDAPRLGFPVDRVVGLVDIPALEARADAAVAAHVPLEGRLTAMLDAGRLCDRAAELVAGAVGTDLIDSEHGGET
jgi:chemotaxis signal transduction protein